MPARSRSSSICFSTLAVCSLAPTLVSSGTCGRGGNRKGRVEKIYLGVGPPDRVCDTYMWIIGRHTNKHTTILLLDLFRWRAGFREPPGDEQSF